MFSSFFKVFRLVTVLLLLLGLLVSGGWWSLKQGIRIDQLDLPAVHINGLSIGLEQKLVIAAERVVLKEHGRDRIRPDEMNRLVYWVKRALPLVRSIQIDDLASGDMHASMTFAENILRLDGNYFSAVVSVDYREGTFYCRISDLLVKPYRAHLRGEASLVPDTGRVVFSGDFKTQEVTGTIELSYQKNVIEADFRTDPFRNLSGMLQQLPVSPEVTSWIEQNIKARTYQIEKLHLRLPVLNKRPVFDPDGIEMTGVAFETDIFFHPELPPVQSKTVNISWKNDRLSFELAQPQYKHISLQGSRVHIAPLIGQGSRLYIDLKTKTRLDKTVLELLAAYDLSLPLRQESGFTRADLQLEVDLNDFATRATGNFITGKGDWLLAEVPLLVRQATVRLDNSRILIKKTEVEFQDILQAVVSGSVDTAAKRADLLLDINQLLIQTQGFDLLQAADISTPVVIDYGSNPFTINLPEYKANIVQGKESIRIDLTDLKAVAPVMPALRSFAFDQGFVTIFAKNRHDYTFQGSIALADNLLYSRGNPVTTFTFHGLSTEQETKLRINQGRITAALTSGSSNVPATLNVIIKDYLVHYVVDTRDNGSLALPLPVHVQGEKARLQFDKLDLLVTGFTVDLNGSDVTLTATLDQGTINLRRNEGKITLTVTGMDANVLQPVINFFDLQEGRLNFKMVGTPDNYEGWLEFNNVLLRDYIVLKNVLAFLDTIPALATFSSPGFDSEGYRIRHGVMHFTMHNGLLTVQTFRTDGETVNSQGSGWVDFTRKRLDIDLDLELMKNLSTIIDKIPLVGYAIQGEDGRLTTSLKITGNIEHPDITTNIAQEIVLAPLNILQRTIAWPFRQLKKMME